jgi:hypothetical protein
MKHSNQVLRRLRMRRFFLLSPAVQTRVERSRPVNAGPSSVQGLESGPVKARRPAVESRPCDAFKGPAASIQGASRHSVQRSRVESKGRNAASRPCIDGQGLESRPVNRMPCKACQCVESGPASSQSDRLNASNYLTCREDRQNSVFQSRINGLTHLTALKRLEVRQSLNMGSECFQWLSRGMHHALIINENETRVSI